MFQFLQLRHVFSLQAKQTNFSQITAPLIDQLASTTEKRGLISSLYGLLMNSSLGNIQVPGRTGWAKDNNSLGWGDVTGYFGTGSSGFYITDPTSISTFYNTQNTAQIIPVAQKRVRSVLDVEVLLRTF